MAEAQGPPVDPSPPSNPDPGAGVLAQCQADLTTCGTNLITCDGNLTTCNTDLGTCNTDLATCEASAFVPQTGQTTCWTAAGAVTPCAGTGQDGDVQAGVAFPVPRFTDNGDGTVTDNLTELVWLKNANCFGAQTWAQALSDANNLADGDCGLMDGSAAGDWHLPNVRELFSLVDFENNNPALPAHPFINFVPTVRWSSTAIANIPNFAWLVSFNDGSVGIDFKGIPGGLVLAVRGGF